MRVFEMFSGGPLGVAGNIRQWWPPSDPVANLPVDASEGLFDWFAKRLPVSFRISICDGYARFQRAPRPVAYLASSNEPHGRPAEADCSDMLAGLDDRNPEHPPADDLYRHFFDDFPDGLVVIGAGGEIEAVNSMGIELLGAASAEHVLRRPLECFVDSEQAAVKALSARTKGFLGMARLMGCDGQIREVTLTLLPFRPEQSGLRLILRRADSDANTAASAVAGAGRLESPRAIAAVEVERSRIARDLHDALGGTLIAARLDLAWVLKRLRNDFPAAQAIAETTDQIMRSVDQALTAIREITSELSCPPTFASLGLKAAMESHLRRVLARSPISARLVAEAEVDLKCERALSVFRIFQEAITNVRRHSGASEVIVELSSSQATLVLTIRDDGCGIKDAGCDSGNSISFGITSMRDRARQLSGTLEVCGNEGSGTCIRLEIPLEDASGIEGAS